MSDTNVTDRTRREAIPTTKFAELWNQAESLEDFCNATGMDTKSASSRASMLRRKKGLSNLKKHGRGVSGTRIDYAAINASLAATREESASESGSINEG